MFEFNLYFICDLTKLSFSFEEPIIKKHQKGISLITVIENTWQISDKNYTVFYVQDYYVIS